MYRKSKSMFGKLLLLLLTLCCAIVLLFGLAACSETKGIASAVINDNGELVITLYRRDERQPRRCCR